MKTANDFKTEIKEIKNNIKKLLEKLALNFEVDEVLNFDTITYKDMHIDLNSNDLKKQNYLILANETYCDYIEEDGRYATIEKKTRTTLLSLKPQKMLKMKEEELFEKFFDYTKFISLFNRYKLLRKELTNLIDLNFTEVSTWEKLLPVLSFEYVEDKINFLINKDEKLSDLIELQNELKQFDKLIFHKRSSVLVEKLKKN